MLPRTSTGVPIAVVGQAPDLSKAVRLVGLLHPHAIVTDLDFPGEDRYPLTRLREASPRSRVLVLSERDEAPIVRAAFDQGAAGYLVCPTGTGDVVGALRTIVAGERYLDDRLRSAVLQNLEGSEAQLSEREGEVLEQLAAGYTNAEIAARLVISIRTVETHRSNIQRKLGVRTRAELVTAAFSKGMAEVTFARRAATA